MPKMIDIEGFCKDLKEVSSIKILDRNGKFHPAGLFSEQIFGPVKNYTCQCGLYYGLSRSGGTCSQCGVDIVNSYERRRRFAKIVLPLKVMNPLFYDLLYYLGGKDVLAPIEMLMKNEKSFMYKDEGEFAVTNSDHPSQFNRIWEKSEAIHEIISGLSHDMAREGSEAWKFIERNINNLFIKEIIVLPSDLRPVSRGANKDSQVRDEINRFYIQILTKKTIMKESIIDINTNKDLYYQYWRQLQKDVNELYDHVLSKLSKKEGLIRGNILGKRIDFSGRAVIVPDPTLKLNECYLPYFMILELYKLHISKRLIELGKFKLLNKAIDFIDECIEFKDFQLFDISNQIIQDEVCLLNRQPSLHRLSMIGFYIKQTKDDVIRIHPLVCSGFNADFDGDQMAVYIPVSKETKKEIKEKFMVTKNFVNPANGGLTTLPSQDIILGTYLLTTNKFPDLQKQVEYKGDKVSESVKLFNDCLPQNFPLVNESVGKNQLLKILDNIKDSYPEEVTANTLDKIKDLGFKYSTLYGCTISLDDAQIKEADDFKISMYSSTDPIEQLTRVSSQETEKFLKDHFKYAYMVESGSRGNWEQIRQLVLTRGFVSNFEGEIIPYPIKNSLIDGLDREEFFNSTYGCRKGLLDVALNTGTSGYLSRKLVFACANLQVHEELDDCGTTECLKVFVDTPKKALMLINRYMVSGSDLERITLDNCNNLVGKVIYIRSPIFCKSYNICHKCYGDLYKYTGSKFAGILAAQSMGECNTQLILRVFHTSGVANVRGEHKNMLQKDVIADLSMASGLLHKIDKNETPDNLVSRLFEIYNTSRDIYHVHFECVISQLMWNGPYKWRVLKNREKIKACFSSIQSVPSKESWLLGLGFSNPKIHILKGLIHQGHYKGVFDQILLGEKFT
jgi:DNA-directed RNA polymerase subunit beta'